MTTAIATKQNGAQALEKVLLTGDLKDLSAEERVQYALRVCESVGLNPLTRPLEYIVLNGKLTLYARKDATDQLRKLNHVSIEDLEESQKDDVWKVKARAVTGDGRRDVATGAVSIKGLSGEALANALMKAETKAKRRVTLSICGLGMLDESEVETVPQAGRGLPEQTPTDVTFTVTDVPVNAQPVRDNPVMGYNVETVEPEKFSVDKMPPDPLEQDDVLPSAASLRARYDKARKVAITEKKVAVLGSIWREQVQEGKGWDDLAPAAQVRLVSDYEAALEL